MEDCLDVVNMWMASNYMFMNNNKTEYLPVIPKTATATALVDGSVIRVGDATITASRFVRNLGVVIDHHLDFKKQVSSIVIVCSFHLRHINKMSRYLPMVTKERVVNAIITSWLDYCNCLLYGTSVNNIARLQRIHNSAARLILRRPRRDSAMPLLCILHWLPVPQRIEFKIIAFTYKAVHGNAPKYLSDLVCPYKPARALCSVVAAATLWNVLHVHSNIKTFACLATFEARLKTHFFLLLLRLSLMFVYFYRYFS